jgi:hypothetical protein
MIDIVRADGPLRAAFDETERLLQRAREDALFNDHPALARNIRFLRLVGVHALRVFTQCRKEIQPLYESLRRSSFIAEGAARALEKLQAEGLSKWGNEHLIGISVWRFQNVPGDAAISLALRRVIEHPPEPPPVLEFAAEREDPGELVRLMWNTADVLAGFSGLVFHRDFQVTFTDKKLIAHQTTDGEIEASPLILTST